MLRPDVIEAVQEGRFHIYAISTIEEGIELLTGMPAGEEDEEGNYPPGTLYHLVRKKLEAYAERMRQTEKAGKEESGSESQNPEDQPASSDASNNKSLT